MADSIQATPRNQWLGKPADWLGKLQAIAQAMAPYDAYGGASAVDLLLGNLPKYLDKASYGESLAAPPQETGPDPSLARKYGEPALELGSLVPAGKVAALAKSLGGVGLLGTLLSRSHLVQLAKTEPEMVKLLEEARRASMAASKAGATSAEAWLEGSKKLKGTPYAGWFTGSKTLPPLFEVSDVGAGLTPRFYPRGADERRQALSGVLHRGDLGDVYSHPELEKFLPDMPAWSANLELSPGGSTAGTGRMQPHRVGLPLIEAEANNPGALRSSILHEGQHAAMLDAWPPGLLGTNANWQALKLRQMYPTMPESEIFERSWANYLNDPGEMMARSVERRRLLPAEDLRNMPLIHELRSQYTPVDPITHPSIAELTAAPPPDFNPSSAAGLSALAAALVGLPAPRR